MFLLALSTGHKVGLGVSGAVFIVFALASAVLLPRYRPQFPSGALWAFVVVALALFGGMLAAVVVFGAEPKVARKSAHTTAQPTASSPRAATTVQVSEKEFKIMLASTRLMAGQVTFDVKNVGTVPHDLVIAGTSDRTKLISPGQTATLTAQLKPGRYELYCSVAGHKQAGMDEKITVAAGTKAPAPQPAATTVQVSEKEFKITLASTTLKAGQVTFVVKNVGTVPHDLVIAGTSDRTKLIAPGQTAMLMARLKPGRYELYCSVAGHKQAGMDEKVLVS